MKTLLRVVAALGALTALAVAGGRWYLRSAEAENAGELPLAGLRAPVEVWRDSLGVPHVWAASEADLFRATGYLHARDRLWQMEFFRRVVDGRLAEVLGADLVATDRFLRTLGMGRAAAEEERRLDPELRALFQAYADGVNSALRHRSGSLPPEFVTLRFEPEPWTVRHSLGISKLMAWDLADWQTGLDLQRAVDRVGAERGRLLVPGYPEWGARILEPGAPAAAAGTAAAPAPRGAPRVVAGVELPRIPPQAERALDALSVARASNAWVIGGSRTRSGKPIVANDPHLALRAPSLWYLAALHGERMQAAGVTIPGVPLVVLGRTERVAWGFTNAMLDDVDFYVEQLHPQDSTRYRTPDGWAALSVRPETIRVRDAEPLVHRVRTTRNGPVMSDVEPRAGGRVLSMRWTALAPSTTPRALLEMNRARDAAELLAALRWFDDPHQNVVFADADGSFGYRMTGRVPVRRGGDGLLPVPGWTGEGEWTGFLPREQHPQLMNPPEGYVVTANNAHGGPHFLGSSYADPFRAMRILGMVAPARGLTADDVARQQMDVRDEMALRYRPHAVRATEAAGDAAAARRLREWDGRATADSRPAALFYTWYENLRGRVSDDEFGGRQGFFPRYALNRVLDGEGAEWVDDVRTPARESLAELSERAMRDAIRVVGDRPWGELHTVRMEHALGTVAALDRLMRLNVGPFPAEGSPFTVNVASFGRRAPFVTTHGPSMRHVADLGDLDGAGGFVIPTGQSGLPFSDRYRDQAERWRTGRLWPLPLDRAAAARRAVERMTLRP